MSAFMRAARERFGAMRFDLGEASGGLGDLGTFIPIVASLVMVSGLDVGSVLLFAGLANVATGFLFNQPIPVQPMKAIAAVAIAEGLSPGAIAAAGLGAGAVVLVIGVTGLMGYIERLVPRPIVRGIQLGVGLKLLIKGIELIQTTPAVALDSWATAAAAAALVLVATRWQRFPSALVLFAAGLAVMLLAHPDLAPALSLGWSGPELVVPTAAEWHLGLLSGTVAQVPLTILNSVIAVCALSADLFVGRGIGVRPMAMSVGLMNLAGCWFGGMPVCHGAGGLAGQHRFGGRTGGSVVLLGAAKVAAALLLGSSAAVVLAAYPKSVLGVLLAFAGAELALPARSSSDRDAFFLTAVTAAGILAVSTALGAVIGLLAALLMTVGRKRRGT